MRSRQGNIITFKPFDLTLRVIQGKINITYPSNNRGSSRLITDDVGIRVTGNTITFALPSHLVDF